MPVILRVAGDVAVEDRWNGNGHDGRLAVKSHGDRNIEIVDLPVTIQIRKAEIGSEDHRTCAEGVNLSVRSIVLKLATNLKRVLAKRPRKRIANLITVEKSGLGQIEILAVSEVREESVRW